MKGLLFTYCLTYGGAFASLFNPWYGLLIYICFAIIKPEALWFWSVPAGNYSRIVAIALLAGWALHGFGNWNFGRAKPIVYALLGFWAWSIICTLFAQKPDLAWGFIEQKTKIFLPFLVGITLIDSVEKAKQLAWVLVLSLGYVAYDLNMSYYDGFNRLTAIGFATFDNNSLCIGMVAGAGLAFFLGLGQNVWWRKLAAFGCAALMAHTPMFGMSRGGMLGLIVTGIVAFYLVPKRPKDVLAFATALIVALSLAGPSVIQRFSSSFTEYQHEGTASRNRLDFWGFCWELMLDEPIFGVGPDNYPAAARARFDRGGEAHSLWLQTGAEMGFPGLALLLTFYLMAVVQLNSSLKWLHNRADPWFSDTARMVIASITGFVVSASFVSLEGLEFPYYVVLVGAGTLTLAPELLAAPQHDESHDLLPHPAMPVMRDA